MPRRAADERGNSTAMLSGRSRRPARLASNRNQVRLSVVVDEVFEQAGRGDVARACRRPRAPRASAAATALLSAISSRSMSLGVDELLVVVLDASAAWRSGRSSAASCRRSCARARRARRWCAKICVGLLVEQQMVVAEVRPADVPVEILGLEIERKAVGQDAVQRLGNVATPSSTRSVGVSRSAAVLPRFELVSLCSRDRLVHGVDAWRLGGAIAQCASSASRRS